MKRAQIENAIKNKNKVNLSTHYCHTHYVDAIVINDKLVCGFCRSVPEKIIKYETEQLDGTNKVVFYKLCPTCGDVVRIVKDYKEASCNEQFIMNN
ncbi:MAG TPA: hypothetical protein VHT34_09405 [Clostridia bacterium]|nr:hypothetical protein [Clostridia bacterium]